MTKQFKLLYKVSIIILAILAAMLIGSIILMTIGADVLKTYMVILFEPLKTTLQLSEVLLRAIPLTIIALGISVAYRSGIINIGAEGQMAMGILGTTAVALAFPELPKPVLLPMAVLAGAISGGFWGFIPGFLKAKLQVSELLSTVMLNYIAAQFYTFLLRGPMLDPAELTMGSGTPSRCASRAISGWEGFFPEPVCTPACSSPSSSPCSSSSCCGKPAMGIRCGRRGPAAGRPSTEGSA